MLQPTDTARVPDWELCIIATFEKTPMSKLPRIFRHFCVHLFPHDDIPTNKPCPHIHSMPEWCRPNAWVIAWRFVSTRSFEGKWAENIGPTQREITWTFGTRAMGVIEKECDLRRETWMEECMDPAVAAAHEAEFWEHFSDRGRHLRDIPYGDCGSITESKVTFDSTRPSRGARIAETIPEEPNGSLAGGPVRPDRGRRRRKSRHSRQASRTSQSSLGITDTLEHIQLRDMDTRSVRSVSKSIASLPSGWTWKRPWRRNSNEPR